MTRKDFEAQVQAEIDRLCAAEAPPVPTRRRYTFSVYLEVPEPVDENDVDGYTRADVEALMKRLLASYAAPFRQARAVADWELMDDEPVEDGSTTRREPTTRRPLTRQEFLEGLADRGIDTDDDYFERK